MGQEGLGPESVPVPGPLHYSPILALLFGREETVITNLKKGQGEETDWQAQRGPVIALSPNFPGWPSLTSASRPRPCPAPELF